jgi:hypothetical protein
VRLADPSLCADSLADYVELTGQSLRRARRSPRAQAIGNAYGDTVGELALGLLYELQARPGDWQAFCTAVAAERERVGAFWVDAGGEALLRKKVNDMYAVLRDKVDADNYQAACGRPCSPNRMYAYRMLDTAYGDIARLFADWEQHQAQHDCRLPRRVGAALERDPGSLHRQRRPAAYPLEALRQPEDGARQDRGDAGRDRRLRSAVLEPGPRLAAGP